jgi:3-oxoacyl-(acyl-carrier-protein) synthase
MSGATYRRVVITGLGVVAPNGIGKEAFWQACVAGRSGVRRISDHAARALPSTIAGEVADFDPAELGLTSDERTHMERATQLGLAAANLAMRDAQVSDALTEEERDATGVYMGTAMASVKEAESLWVQLTESGLLQPPPVPASDVSNGTLLTNASAAAIAAHHHLHGPCLVIATGCSAGTDAIGQALWAIQEGRADRMLAGGTDSSISYASMNVFSIIGALSTRNNEPERASRPYDAGRDGFVMAEGAAVLLLEERRLAIERGAHIYAELTTYCSNSNAYHMTTLPRDGAALRQLLRNTLAAAGVSPAELDYVNSHGSSTPDNEIAETSAYKAVFGDDAYRIPISATKSLIGHAQGAAGAIEAVATALAIEEQTLPPTINQEMADPECDLDYVPNVARRGRVDVALTHSSGFGGLNAALVLVRP